MYAAYFDVMPMVSELIATGGVDVHKEDLAGNTALHFAYAAGAMNVAAHLESCKADVNQRNFSGRTALDVMGCRDALSISK